MRVADLRASDRNPRTISTGRLENLKRSLASDAEFLEVRPLLVNSYPGRENIVIAGNMRLRAAQALGWDEVPVLMVSVPPEIEAQWNLKDNNQWGDYIEDDLAQILTDLTARGVDTEILGFEPDAVERLLGLESATTQGDDDDFDPAPPTFPASRPGDLLLLGPHRLVCGDSRDASTWSLLMESGEDAGTLADAIWTDPPYGVDLAGVALPSRGEGNDLAIAGDLPHEVAPLLASVFPHADRWLKPGAPFYVAGPSGRTAVPFIEQIEGVGWHLAQTLVWVKNSFVPGRADYHYQHEAVYYGWKPGAPHQWLGALDQATVIDDEARVGELDRRELVALVKALRNARATDVVRVDKTRHNDLHPTMKPTALIRHMLANSTRRGDVVLDPFAGSGSTLVACELLGRRAALIELEPRFCDVIVRRWTELSAANTVRRLRAHHEEGIDGSN
jgi:DNA modification methylase